MVAVAPHHVERRALNARPFPRLLVQLGRERVLVGVITELEVVARLEPDVPGARDLEAGRGLLAEVAVVGPDGVIDVELKAEAEEVQGQKRLPPGKDRPQGGPQEQDMRGAQQVVLAIAALLAEIQGVGRAEILVLEAVLELGEVGIVLEEREGGGAHVAGQKDGAVQLHVVVAVLGAVPGGERAQLAAVHVVGPPRMVEDIQVLEAVVVVGEDLVARRQRVGLGLDQVVLQPEERDLRRAAPRLGPEPQDGARRGERRVVVVGDPAAELDPVSPRHGLGRDGLGEQLRRPPQGGVGAELHRLLQIARRLLVPTQVMLGQSRVEPVLLLEADVAGHVLLEIRQRLLVLLPLEVDEPEVVAEVVAPGLLPVDEQEMGLRAVVLLFGEMRDTQVEGDVEIGRIQLARLLEMGDRLVRLVQGQIRDPDEVPNLRVLRVDLEGLEEVLERLGVLLVVVLEDPAVDVHADGLGAAWLGGRAGREGHREGPPEQHESNEQGAAHASHGRMSP